jgi:hypothetical protein
VADYIRAVSDQLSAVSPQLLVPGGRRHRVAGREGTFGTGVFGTFGIQDNQERPSGWGVEFVSLSQEEFCDTEALVENDVGNWISLTQRRR